MAMRELVTGGAACAVPGSSSSSNPFGNLANAFLNSSAKGQDLKELPSSLSTSSDAQFYPEAHGQQQLPGSEFDQPYMPPAAAQSSEFLRNFNAVGGNGMLENAWDEVQGFQPPPPMHGPQVMYDHGASAQLQPTLDGPPQRVLSNFLHSFVESSRGGMPFRPTQLPVLGLSAGDKQCIRDRSSIMARHFFADKSEVFINGQVNALLSSLDIDGDANIKGPLPARFRELEGYWNESQAIQKHGPHATDGWVTEFSQHRVAHGDPNAWAHSFEQQHGANGWASEFEQEQSQVMSADHMRVGNMANLAAIEQTRMLANTLAQNEDPKFQKSRFLQFVSKMSRGELIIDDNQVKQATSSSSGDWAGEYQQQYNAGSNWANEYAHGNVKQSRANDFNIRAKQWANEFGSEQEQHGSVDDQWVNQFSKLHVDFQQSRANDFNIRAKQWANEFGSEQEQHGSVDDQWVNQFSKLHVDDWAEEFGNQVGEGILGDSSADSWANTYDEFLNEQVATKQRLDSSRGVYVFSDMNPYVGHPNPLKEGQDMFHKGLLSEAVLALEAEVLKNPDNAEGWRLLGIAHAENDDDQQAIAAMMRAQEADPTNLEVLLALGVSHTNELEQSAALKYLYGWLRNHPKYGVLARPELSPDSLYHADVARTFSEAAQMSPEDADVHIVLGVLYNLSREYDKAIESFRTALKLKPQDYSLWNKLGATQANSVQSADAILAYQQALDLKPNYVRAWANMGISYANQGMYEDSIRYYVRALTMNPKADNGWQYLRISLSCASRTDMLEACDSRNLDILQKEFPL